MKDRTGIYFRFVIKHSILIKPLLTRLPYLTGKRRSVNLTYWKTKTGKPEIDVRVETTKTDVVHSFSEKLLLSRYTILSALNVKVPSP